MSDLARRLRLARESSGLSARALDKKAEITSGHTTLIESGRRADPSGETIRKLAAALGISTDWLLTGDEADATGPRQPMTVAMASALLSSGTNG